MIFGAESIIVRKMSIIRIYHTADQPTAPSGIAIKIKQPAHFFHKDTCKTRKDTKYCITKQGPNTEPLQTMGAK